MTGYGNSNATATVNLAQQGSWFGVAGGGNATAIDTTESVTLQFASGAAMYGIGHVWTRSWIVISGFASNPGFTDPTGYASNVSYTNGTLTYYYNWDSGTEHDFRFSNPSASAGRTLRINVFDAAAGWQATITRVDYTPTPAPAMANVGVVHQTMENFSASDAWSMQMIGAWSEANKNLIAELLFSTNTGIGLSAWRFNLAAGYDPTVQSARPGWQPWRTENGFLVASNSYDWNRQAGQRWFLSAAKAWGVNQYIADCYSPPTNFTRNGRVYSTDTTYSSNLKPGYEPAFAQFIGDVLAHFKTNPVVSERINFNYVMPVNEPFWDWASDKQEGCRYGNADIISLTRALSAALKARGLDTQIVLPEAGNIASLYQQQSVKYGESYGNYMSAFSGITNLTANILSAHSYFSDNVTNQLVSQRQTLHTRMAANPFWKYWQTEYCVLQWGRDLTMTTAMNVARVIWADLTVADASAWQWWLSISPADYKDGLLYTDYFYPGDRESLFCSKNFWAFGQWSRFIRPGWKRVGMTSYSNVFGLMSAGFVSPATNSLAMVFVNAGANSQLIAPSVTGLGADSAVSYWSPWITSDRPSDNLSPLPPCAPGGTIEIPTNSIVTLVATIASSNAAPPFIAPMTNQNATVGQLVSATANITSSNTPASLLNISVASDNPSLLPNANVIVSNQFITGAITRELFSNFSGSGLSNLVAAPAFPNSPSVVTFPSLFEAPQNIGGNFGTRIRGYVVPPETGDYTFWISSSGASQLFLSSDENPVDRIEIASVTNFTSSREWTKEPNQQSAPIFLTAGKRYYIEAIQASRGTGDNLAVGWQLPDKTLERPIPGRRLSPWSDPYTNSVRRLILMQLATNQVGSANVSVVATDPLGLSTTNVFTVTVPTANRNPTNLMWQVNGNRLNLSWPRDHIGWKLQVQTNPLARGLGTNWFLVLASAATNFWSVPLSSSNGAIFYRLFLKP